MNKQQEQQVKRYLDILVRRKVLILATLLFSIAVGLAYYVITPKMYQATSLLIYQQQKINPTKNKNDIEGSVRELVSTLTQQVTSRTSLEKIIKNFNLYPDLVERLPLEDVIESMRKYINIKPTKGNIYLVSYQGDKPKKVLKVTNALSSKFIEENLKYREEMASDNSEYLRDELVLAKKNLNKTETITRDYKLKHYNEMPQQLENNVARMTMLQVKLQGVQNNIQELERTKALLQLQYQNQDSTEKIIDPDSAPELIIKKNRNNNRTKKKEADTTDKLTEAMEYLNSLQTKYKDAHPEIKRIRRIIKTLEKEAMELSTAIPPDTDNTLNNIPDPEVVDNNNEQNPNTLKNKLLLELKNINLTIADLKREGEELREKTKQLEKWIEATPVREAEWSALTRDYTELKRHYDYLVAKNLQADSVENLERKQKGSQFKIMDAARLPEKPLKPDFKMIVLIALGAGLALGGSIAVGLSVFDTTFRDPKDMEMYLGVPVSCSVPYLYTGKEKLKMRINAVFWFGFLFTGYVLVGLAAAYLWKKGIIII